MSYTELAATGIISEDRLVLNGITTRQDSLLLFTDAAALAATWARKGALAYAAFDTGDDAHLWWTPNDRISRDVDATLRLLCIPDTVETSKFCEFTLTYDSFAVGTALIDGTPTINSGDVTVPGTQWEVFEIDLTIPQADFAATELGLGFQVARSTPTGTDALGDIGIIGASIIYEVDR